MMFTVNFDQEQLSRVVREAVRKEVEPLMRMLSDRHLSVEETMKLLDVKSRVTIRRMIAQGKLRPVSNSPTSRPKFLFSEVIKIKQ